MLALAILALPLLVRIGPLRPDDTQQPAKLGAQSQAMLLERRILQPYS